MTMDKTLLWKISYGMYAIGVRDGERLCGCIVNTAAQITSDPVTIAVSVNHNNYTHDLIAQNGRFALTILSEQSVPLDISYLGFSSGRDRDKWAEVAHGLTDSGLPYATAGSCGYLECEVRGSYDAGTHTVFFAEVLDAVTLNEAVPMTYSYYHNVIKGKAPKNAPTYQEPAPEAPAPAAEKYACSICGYVYPGDFSEAPDDYVCPLCGAPRSQFVKR